MGFTMWLLIQLSRLNNPLRFPEVSTPRTPPLGEKLSFWFNRNDLKSTFKLSVQNCWTAKHCSLEVDPEDHIVAVRGASELGYGYLLTAIEKPLQNKWQVFILDHQDSKPRPAASSPQTYWKHILGSIMLRFKWKEFNIEYFFLAS